MKIIETFIEHLIFIILFGKAERYIDGTMNCWIGFLIFGSIVGAFILFGHIVKIKEGKYFLNLLATFFLIPPNIFAFILVAFNYIFNIVIALILFFLSIGFSIYTINQGMNIKNKRLRSEGIIQLRSRIKRAIQSLRPNINPNDFLKNKVLLKPYFEFRQKNSSKQTDLSIKKKNPREKPGDKFTTSINSLDLEKRSIHPKVHLGGNLINFDKPLICYICNYKNPSGSRLCISCHSKFLKCSICEKQISKEDLVFCPNCSTPYHEREFLEWLKVKAQCKNCKKNLELWDFQKYLEEHEQEYKLPSKFCINCGKYIPIDANFCIYCGFKI